MSDRLHELLRQRAAIQAHLAWLDREIAQQHPPAAPDLRVAAPETTIAPPAPVSSLAPVPSLPGAAELTGDLDEVLTRYQPDTTTVRSDVRKGCLLYFFGAFVLLALGVGLFSFISSRFLHSDSRPSPTERSAQPAGP